nr:hypothetical protein [Tanacetum cinerariifolium]
MTNTSLNLRLTVINASGQWKYSFYTDQKFKSPKEAKDRVYLHSIESRRNLKLYKYDGVRIRARCDGKVLVFKMSQGTGQTGPNRGMEAGPSGSSGDDIDLHPNLKFTFISDRQKGWCGQAYKDLLWSAASATIVRDFEKAKSDLLLNNICLVFNGKIVGGRDKPMITLLEYINEYCMKRIVNVQGVIDKCTGPLTPTATRIMKSIKKEAYLIKEMRIDRDSFINAFDLDKGTDMMKEKIRQENMCEEEVPLNNNIGKQTGDFVDMPIEAVEQGMDANVPNKIDGVKGEQVPNHVVKKGKLEFLACKEVANPDVNKLVAKGRQLKRKKVYAE